MDCHVGAKVRLRRKALGMSQEKLGDALQVTFQQVQKYEKGVNRIGASRLLQISHALNVPTSFFFDGAPAVDGAAGPHFVDSAAGDGVVFDFGDADDEARLRSAFARIKSAKMRKMVLDLAIMFGESDGAKT